LLVFGGCSTSTPQVYLHSARLQKNTQQTKDDFRKIKVDQYFGDQQKQFTAFAAQEDAAVTDYLVASRNRQLTLLLRTDPVSFAYKTQLSVPTATLRKIVDSRLQQITGHPDGAGHGDYNQEQLELLRVGPAALLDAKVAIEIDRTFYQDALGAFNNIKEAKEAKDDRPTDCDVIPLDQAACKRATNSIGDTPDQAYDQLVCKCVILARRIHDAAQITSQYYDLKDGSELAVVNVGIKTLQDSINKEKDDAKQIADLIKRLKDSGQGTFQQDFDNLAKKLTAAKGFAKFTGATEISKILEAILAGDLSSSTSTSSSSGGDTSSGGGTSTDGTASRGAAGSSSGTGKSGKSQTPVTRGTIAVLKSTRALAGISDAFAEEPRIERVNSVLIAIAEQRQNLDMANLDIDYENKHLYLLYAEAQALLTEVGQLATTKLLLPHIPGARANGFTGLMEYASADQRDVIGATLAAYEASWNEGQIPFWVLQFKEVQLYRAFSVDQAAKTAANWQQLLQPAVDELVAYGQGGIPPETIASVIYNLGLIATVATR